MGTLGEFNLTVVREHNGIANVPFPVELVHDSMIELASVTLSCAMYAVVLQAAVNWNAAFTIPPPVGLGENGFVEVTFQILRDGQVIYQVAQTIRQKDFELGEQGQTNITYEVAPLLHLDPPSLSCMGGMVTYTLRATDIALFTQTGVFTEGTPSVRAAVGAATFIAQEVGYTRDELETKGVEPVVVDEGIATLPVTIPFPTPLMAGDTVELARIKVEPAQGKNSILLMAVVNWGLRVTSNGVLATLTTGGSAHVAFELVRNGEVIYRVTQTSIQAYSNKAIGPIENAMFEIADLSVLDIPSRRKHQGVSTYILRAINIDVIDPVLTSGGPAFSTASVGPVTLVAEELGAKKMKRRRHHGSVYQSKKGRK